MTTLIIIVAVGLVAGFVWLWLEAKHAPYGKEGPNGFELIDKPNDGDNHVQEVRHG